jgi:hypothetical protein
MTIILTAFFCRLANLREKRGSSAPKRRLRPPPGGSPAQFRRISEPGGRMIRPPAPAERMTRRVTRPKVGSFRVWSRIIRSPTTSDPTSERINRPRLRKIRHLRGGSSAPAERRASQRADHPLEVGGRGRFFAGDPPEGGGEGCFGAGDPGFVGELEVGAFARTLGPRRIGARTGRFVESEPRSAGDGHSNSTKRPVRSPILAVGWPAWSGPVAGSVRFPKDR